MQLVLIHQGGQHHTSRQESHHSPPGCRGGAIILKETNYIVIVCDMKHLGDEPESLGEDGEFVGKRFEARFHLPSDVDTTEESVIQCRIKSNEIGNKIFLLNSRNIEEVLMPHPENKDEWLQDIAVIPGGYLAPGENVIDIGYTDERYDDFLVDNIVLWYKITDRLRGNTRCQDLDSLDHLAEIDGIDIEKDVP